jgi:hypothetical protein
VRVLGGLLVQATGAQSVSLGVPIRAPRQPGLGAARSGRCVDQVPRITAGLCRMAETGHGTERPRATFCSAGLPAFDDAGGRDNRRRFRIPPRETEGQPLMTKATTAARRDPSRSVVDGRPTPAAARGSDVGAGLKVPKDRWRGHHVDQSIRRSRVHTPRVVSDVSVP